MQTSTLIIEKETHRFSESVAFPAATTSLTIGERVFKIRTSSLMRRVWVSIGAVTVDLELVDRTDGVPALEAHAAFLSTFNLVDAMAAVDVKLAERKAAKQRRHELWASLSADERWDILADRREEWRADASNETDADSE
jgi:hypothetical protein